MTQFLTPVHSIPSGKLAEREYVPGDGYRIISDKQRELATIIADEHKIQLPLVTVASASKQLSNPT